MPPKRTYKKRGGAFPLLAALPYLLGTAGWAGLGKYAHHRAKGVRANKRKR